MGTGCCGRNYEGTISSDNGGILVRRRRGSRAIANDPIMNSPLPDIKKDYLYLPNRFVNGQRKNSLAGTTGLENNGNTCFINAALQCISNAVPLTDYFLTAVYLEELNVHNVLGTSGELAGAYAELLSTQWRDVNESLLPKRLLSLIFYHAPQFADGRQHDAHEFLAFFLDKIHEDLNRGDPDALFRVEEVKYEKEERMAARAWYSYLKKNSSVVVDLFQGQLKSSVTCWSCKFVSTTFDTFMYLSLPIPKTDRAVTLVDCLMEFTKDEPLDPGEWICPKCKRQDKASKKIDIWKVPPILIIHLKRFYFKESSFGKLHNRVDFPVSSLDVSCYVSSRQKEPPVYDLFAKTDHMGDISCGHYSAYGKNRYSHLWYSYDDDLVREVCETDVCNDKAYMLFYCKISVSEYRRQSSTLPDLWPHIISRKDSWITEENAPDRTGSTLSCMNELEVKNAREHKPKAPLNVIPSQSESPTIENCT